MKDIELETNKTTLFGDLLDGSSLINRVKTLILCHEKKDAKPTQQERCYKYKSFVKIKEKQACKLSEAQINLT